MRGISDLLIAESSLQKNSNSSRHKISQASTLFPPFPPVSGAILLCLLQLAEVLLVFQFVFFGAVIVTAGTFLSRYADEIAKLTGLGRLVIGSVLLASATSLPELSVDIACVRQGSPDLAVGDLLGSSLMNLLILAVLDLTHHSRGKMFSRAASGHALGGAASIALTAMVAIALLVERQMGAGNGWDSAREQCLCLSRMRSACGWFSSISGWPLGRRQK
jgi:Ca2+/Na+ antiporter